MSGASSGAAACPAAGTSVAISDTSTGPYCCALFRNRNHADGLNHADPSRWALVERRNDAQGTEFVVERMAVEFVSDEDVRVLNAGVKFSQREKCAVSVRSFDEDIGRHGRAAKLVTLWRAGQFQQVGQRHALVDFILLVVGICDFQRFVRHAAQVSERKRNWPGDVAGNGESGRVRSSLGKDCAAE